MRAWGWLSGALIGSVGVFLAAALIRPAAPARAAATFTVNSLLDAPAAVPITGTVCLSTNGACTLRAAIQAANLSAGDDLITFDPAVFTTVSHTIVLTVTGAGENAAATGDLDLAAVSTAGKLTITNNGGQAITLDGNGADRVFQVLAGANVTLEDLTITNGKTTGADYGGGIYSAGTLVLRRAALTANQAPFGGGVFVGGGVTNLAQAVLANNQAGDGGGAYVDVGQQLLLTNVTVAQNTATGAGGGLYAGGALSLFNATVSANTAASGSGVFGLVNAWSSILAGNSNGSDCQNVNSQGYNYLGSLTGCTVTAILTGNKTGANPLGAFNGQYFPLSASSPAVDAGDPTGCLEASTAPLTVDQRGGPRPVDGNGDGVKACDMGAYEADVVPTATPTVTASPTATPRATATPTAFPTQAPTAEPPQPAPADTETPIPTATPSPTPAMPLTYVVQPGDTLFGLAQRFNTTMAVLRELNGLTGWWLYAGQTLMLPGAAPAATPLPGPYIVQPGDTLFRLAVRYGTTVADLQALNGLGASVTIYVGQILQLPGAPAPVPAPVVPAPSATPTAPAGWPIHIVRPGETLYQLALQYQTTVAALQAANALGVTTVIYAGQALVIPSAPAAGAPLREYVVQPGDTLFRLSLQFDTTITLLQRLNGLAGTVIYVGQRLSLP